jgi:hypothetical protein
MMLGMILEFVSDYVFRFFRMRAIVKPSVSFPEGRTLEGRTLEGRYLAGRDMQERNRQDQIGLEEVG